jgi:hypothetical protein
VVIVESHGTAGDDPGMFAEMNLRMLAWALRYGLRGFLIKNEEVPSDLG